MNILTRWACGLWLVCMLLPLSACGTPPPGEPAGATATTASVQPAATQTMEPPDTPTATETAEAAPTSGSAETDLPTRGLLVNVTTDDTWSASMALSLATNARDQGLEPVVIFLNVRGVYLADRERLPATEGNSDMNIHEKFQAFIEKGGQVIACPSCTKEAGMTQEDYIDGVVVGEPGGIIRFLSDPAITVMSYTKRTGQK